MKFLALPQAHQKLFLQACWTSRLAGEEAEASFEKIDPSLLRPRMRLQAIPSRQEQFQGPAETSGETGQSDGKKKGKGKGKRGWGGGKKPQTKSKAAKGRGRGKGGGRGRGKAKHEATMEPNTELDTGKQRKTEQAEPESATACEAQEPDNDEMQSAPVKSDGETPKPHPKARAKAQAKAKAKAKSKPQGKAKAKPQAKPKQKQAGKAARQSKTKGKTTKQPKPASGDQGKNTKREKSFARRWRPDGEVSSSHWAALRDAFDEHLRANFSTPSKKEDELHVYSYHVCCRMLQGIFVALAEHLLLQDAWWAFGKPKLDRSGDYLGHLKVLSEHVDAFLQAHMES